jgi:hypothetical protein
MPHNFHGSSNPYTCPAEVGGQCVPQSKLLFSKFGINDHSTPREIQACFRRMSKEIYEFNPGGFGVHHAPMVFNRVKNPH